MLGETVSKQIKMTRESWTGAPAITATYTVDHDAETFVMDLQVPKEYEWVGMHLVSMDFGAAIPCIRQDGETPCTEGLEFYMNETTGEVTMKFTHTTSFIPDTSVVPEASGALFDCQPVQQEAGVCAAGEAIISTGSFGFTAARLPQTQADFQLMRGELVDNIFHITWRRSLERPLDGPTLMIRSAAKPRTYSDPQRRVAMGMPYHGYGPTNTQTIALVESNPNTDASDDDAEPAEQCPPGLVRAFTVSGMGAEAAQQECSTFCSPSFALAAMSGSPTEGSCKAEGYASFVETRSVAAGGPQPMEVAIYVRAASDTDIADASDPEPSESVAAKGTFAGPIVTLSVLVIGLVFGQRLE